MAQIGSNYLPRTDSRTTQIVNQGQSGVKMIYYIIWMEGDFDFIV